MPALQWVIRRVTEWRWLHVQRGHGCDLSFDVKVRLVHVGHTLDSDSKSEVPPHRSRSKVMKTMTRLQPSTMTCENVAVGPATLGNFQLDAGKASIGITVDDGKSLEIMRVVDQKSQQHVFESAFQ